MVFFSSWTEHISDFMTLSTHQKVIMAFIMSKIYSKTFTSTSGVLRGG